MLVVDNVHSDNCDNINDAMVIHDYLCSQHK